VEAIIFVPCLVKLLKPEISEMMETILEKVSVDVVGRWDKWCCGQPFFNSGNWKSARYLAEKLLDELIDYQYIISPSGSCIYTIKHHYMELFKNNPTIQKRVAELSKKVYEFSDFLVSVCRYTDFGLKRFTTVAYHDSCQVKRGLGIYDQPRELLSNIEGLRLVDIPDSDRCCGFGGSFSFKYRDISMAIADDKAKNIIESGAEILLGSELSCLMNISIALRRLGSDIRCMHLIEFLSC